MDELIAVLGVAVDDHFAVRCSPEAMTERLQLPMQFPEVVDFTIADHPQRTVCVRQRLMSAGEVDDRQAAHADRARAVRVEALVVGPAMRGDARHGRQQRRVGGLAVKLEDAEDTAHR